jgi:hypothetical protein
MGRRVGEFFTDLELFKLKATRYFETSVITQQRISRQITPQVLRGGVYCPS